MATAVAEFLPLCCANCSRSKAAAEVICRQLALRVSATPDESADESADRSDKLAFAAFSSALQICLKLRPARGSSAGERQALPEADCEGVRGSLVSDTYTQ